MALTSQFRCNGSDGYLSWVDDALQVQSTANPTLEGIEYEFKVFDDPVALKQAILEKNIKANKARMVAGYCWDWVSDSRKPANDSSAMDIMFPEYGFQAQWNLAKDESLWVMAPNSVHELGCIHTCQGLELDYIGVILGEDLVVRDGEVITDAGKRAKTDASIRGYKKLLKENPSLAKEKADIIIKNTYRTLMTRGQKGCYFFSVDPETNAYFKAHAEINGKTLKAEEKYPGLPLVVVDISPEEHYQSAVPLLNIKVAAGSFSMEQQLEVCDWVSLPEPFAHKPGYFVVQVVGESMNRRIPNGAWCLFKSDQGGSRNGKIVMVQSSHIQDVETGSSYTVKSYRSEKVNADVWEHSKIVLSPMSSIGAFSDIELVGEQVESFEVIGEFVAVL